MVLTMCTIELIKRTEAAVISDHSAGCLLRVEGDCILAPCLSASGTFQHILIIMVRSFFLSVSIGSRGQKSHLILFLPPLN